MKIGIAGYPSSGKKTLFGLLTGTEASSINFEQGKPVPGIASARGLNFEKLVEMYHPRKETPAQISIELMPDLETRVIQEGAVFRDISNLDALCLVIRAFRDDAVYHVKGSVDPARDITGLNNEFILHDLLFVEKRMERIELNKKKGRGDDLKIEAGIMERFRAHLEGDKPLRTCLLSPEEKTVITSYPFITLKEMVAVLNVSDEDMRDDSLVKDLEQRLAEEKIEIIRISAKTESEIASLDSDEERNEFLEASGIEEPAINLLFKKCMQSLGLISFFTVGEDEVRQWLVRRGAAAPEAAGVIHSDLERGFIRAEVMKYEDLMQYKTQEMVKKAGRLGIMGKDYIVQDLDILSIRFNV